MPKWSALEEAALRELARRVRGILGSRVLGMTLFGSRARGEGREDSDLDVLVTLEEMTRTDRRQVQDLAFDVGLEYGLSISPVLADPRTWRADLALGRAIERDGVPL